MTHNFDIRIATKFGINSAILLNNIYFWVEKNRANEINFYDGHYWTYNSKKALAKLFPYFTERQIKYALKKLIDEGIIITGNYNESPYNHTLWYAITKKGYDLLNNKLETPENTSEIPEEPIGRNCPIDPEKGCVDDWTELSNQADGNVQSIIGTDIKPDNKTFKKERKKENNPSFDSLINAYTQNEELRKELKEHLRTRKTKKASLTNRAVELSLHRLDKLGKTDHEKIKIVQASIMNGWTAFYPLKGDIRNHQHYNELDNFETSYDLEAYDQLIDI